MDRNTFFLLWLIERKKSRSSEIFVIGLGQKHPSPPLPPTARPVTANIQMEAFIAEQETLVPKNGVDPLAHPPF